MATRRTRILCISDTHGQTPKLPPADVLIHAGDLTNQGSFSELDKQVRWLKAANAKVKIVVCGNHDITCDKKFYNEYGGYFHNKRMEDPDECIALFHADPSIIYLNHEAKLVRIAHDDGAVVSFKIFGSPYSPALRLWAFGYPPEDAFRLWDQIPLDSDIVVTHTPAKFHCDESRAGGSAGCERLREALWRIRPKLHVCGHIHEGYGIEAVEWDLSSPNVKFKERNVRRWKDPLPESKKQFQLDFSYRNKGLSLRHDGSVGRLASRSCEQLEEQGQGERSNTDESDVEFVHLPSTLPPVRSGPQAPFPDFAKAQRPVPPNRLDDKVPDASAAYGRGGPPSSARADQEAIAGREGRAETCIVNAAFMASNWPHKGGKKFRKPILIDLELPVDQTDQFHVVEADG